MPKIKISTGSRGYTSLYQRWGDNLYTSTKFYTSNNYTWLYYFEKDYHRIWTISKYWLSHKGSDSRKILDKRYLSPEKYFEKNGLIRGIEKWL